MAAAIAPPNTYPDYLPRWDDVQTKFIAGADSIHDFKAVRMNPNYFPTIEGKLVNALNTLVPPSSPPPPFNYTGWLSNNSNSNVSSVSKVEDQTVDYYEAQYSIPLKTINKITITYRDVITRITAYTDGTAQVGLLAEDNINIAIYKTNLEFNGGDILEIDLADGEDWDLNYTKTDKMNIGIFLLNFFFMPSDEANAALNSSTATYISFDAHSVMPDKIFAPLDQVINLVTPLNIADSATTFKHLGGQRNYYYFPSVGIPNVWDYASNIFTWGNVEISVSKRAALYDSNSRFNFSLDIRYREAGGLLAVTRQAFFDSDHTSGPGVDYLSQIIFNSNNVTIPNKTLDISDFYSPHIFGNTPAGLNNEAMLLFDIKRSGDAEQCRATKNADQKLGTVTVGRSILSTIDRLCALQSRMMESNTIYHYSTKMILYRFPTDLTDVQLLDKAVAMKYAYKVKLYSAIDCLRDFNKLSESIKTYIVDFQTRIYQLYPSAQFTLPRPNEQVTTLVTQLAKIQLTETYMLLSYVLNLDVDVDVDVDVDGDGVTPDQVPQPTPGELEVAQAQYVLDVFEDNSDKNAVDGRIDEIKGEIERINMRLNGDFFQRLTRAFKRSINASNYQSCIDTLRKDVVTEKDGVYTFKKCEVLQYNYDILKSIYSGFFLILTLDPQKRNFGLLNIPNALEQGGFYSDIKAFISMVEFDVDVNTLVVDDVNTIDTYTHSYVQKTCILLLSILKYSFPLDYKEKSYIVGNSGFKEFCEQCVTKILSFNFPTLPPLPPAALALLPLPPAVPALSLVDGGAPKRSRSEKKNRHDPFLEEIITDYQLLAFTRFTREMTDISEAFFKNLELHIPFTDIFSILQQYELGGVFRDNERRSSQHELVHMNDSDDSNVDLVDFHDFHDSHDVAVP